MGLGYHKAWESRTPCPEMFEARSRHELSCVANVTGSVDFEFYMHEFDEPSTQQRCRLASLLAE